MIDNLKTLNWPNKAREVKFSCWKLRNTFKQQDLMLRRGEERYERLYRCFRIEGGIWTSWRMWRVFAFYNRLTLVAWILNINSSKQAEKQRNGSKKSNSNSEIMKVNGEIQYGKLTYNAGWWRVSLSTIVHQDYMRMIMKMND